MDKKMSKGGKAKRYEKALRDIVKTVDETGRCHGHWHGVAVKIARASLFNYPPDLSDKDLARIERNTHRPEAASGQERTSPHDA